MSQASTWSPWVSWWMDVVQSLLTFSIIAVVTVLILNRLEDRRADARHIAEARFQLRLDALKDFRVNTLKYQRAALEAFTDLYQWAGRPGAPEKTAAMLRYEQEAYQDFQLGVEAVRHRFGDAPSAQSLLASLNRFNDERHRVYDRLVDQKLDGGTWQPGEPRSSRPEFEQLMAEYTRVRGEIISHIETAAQQRIPHGAAD